MKFTGERVIPSHNRGDNTYMEHLFRYCFAARYTHDKVVLDIACGSGYGSNFLLDNGGAERVIGIDISQEAVEYSRANYKRPFFEVGKVDYIPLRDNAVDVVVSFETIEHVDSPTQQAFILEALRVMQFEGVFIVSTPNADIYPKGNRFHLKELTHQELKTLLEQYFTNVKFFNQSNDQGQVIYFIAVCSNSKANVERDYGATFLT